MTTKPDYREQYVKGMATAEMHAATIGLIVDTVFISLGLVLFAYANLFLLKGVGVVITGIWGWNLVRTLRAKRLPAPEAAAETAAPQSDGEQPAQSIKT